MVLIQERLVERQQTLAEAQGQIALGLVQVYRALGGGWQIRCSEQTADAIASGPAPSPTPTTLVEAVRQLVPGSSKPAPWAPGQMEGEPATAIPKQ